MFFRTGRCRYSRFTFQHFYKLLLDENATVTITHSRTKNLADVTREAEILVVAIGRPKFVTADMVGVLKATF